MAIHLRRCPARLAFLLESPLRRPLLGLDRLIASLRLGDPAHVLDLGAGSGVVASEVIRALRHGRVVLVDAQWKMMQRARRRMPARPGVHVAFTVAEAERLPFPPSCFDVVLLVTVLGELDDAAMTLQEVRRVLRSGGLVSISEHLPDPDFRSARRVRSLLDAGGFVVRDHVGGRWSFTINAVRRD